MPLGANLRWWSARASRVTRSENCTRLPASGSILLSARRQYRESGPLQCMERGADVADRGGNLRRRVASLVLWTEFIADSGGMLLYKSFVPGFDHDARQRFCAPVTDDDAARVLEVFFLSIDSSGDGGDGTEARFSRTLTSTMICGKTFRSATNSSRDSPERAARSSTTSAVGRPSLGEPKLGTQDVTRSP
jgi:hypothetical protein